MTTNQQVSLLTLAGPVPCLKPDMQVKRLLCSIVQEALRKTLQFQGKNKSCPSLKCG